MEKKPWIKFIPDEAAMLKLGSQLAQACPSQSKDPLIIFLQGQLGAGKTTLTRGFLQGLGYKGKVKSPTYTLVEAYEVESRPVFHFDLYRLQEAAELDFIGMQDYLLPQAICLMEWPENAKDRLPSPDLSCSIHLHGSGREIKLTAHSVQGDTLLQRVQHV
jgi:tRNA threonylcarbamoyladenosine biosynthesis protein TsaE